MIPRMRDISSLVAAYATGDFDKRLKVSDRHDEADALIGGLHMLGEMLRAVTVSKDFFESILDTLPDMAMVLSPKGVITFANRRTCERLEYPSALLVGKGLDTVCGETTHLWWSRLRKNRGPDGLVRIWSLPFFPMKGEAIEVEITIRPMPVRGTSSRGSVLLMAQEVAPREQEESRLLRAVNEGRELERKQIAQDLHDGMGQAVTAARFLLEAALKDKDEDSHRAKLLTASEMLTGMLTLIQTACRKLVSRTLEESGLVPALRELGYQMTEAKVIRISVVESQRLPPLSKPLGLDLFRVVQEFMTNSIRHGQATCLWIRLGMRDGAVQMELRDNGRGFNLAQGRGKGTGIDGMLGRVRSHGGSFELHSRPGMGTEARVRVMANQS